MTFNNIGKLFVLFLFVGFLLGVGFAVESCDKYDKQEIPNAPMLTTSGCTFLFNFKGLNKVNQNQLFESIDTDYVFKLDNGDQIRVGVSSHNSTLGWYADFPSWGWTEVNDVEFAVAIQEKGNSDYIDIDTDVELDLDNTESVDVPHMSTNVINFSVTMPKENQKAIVLLKPSQDWLTKKTTEVVSTPTCNLETQTFTNWGDFCQVEGIQPHFVTLPDSAVANILTGNMTYTSGGNKKQIAKILISKTKDIYCVENTQILELELIINEWILTAKQGTCPEKKNVKDCLNSSLPDSYSCKKDSTVIFDPEAGTLNLGNVSTIVSVGSVKECTKLSDKTILKYYVQTENRVLLCQDLIVTPKATPNNYNNCTDLDSTKMTKNKESPYLIDGIPDYDDKYAYIKVDNATSVYVKELDTYYRINPKDKTVWQKCTKGTGTATTTPKEGAKTKKGKVSESLKKEFDDACKKYPDPLLCD